MKIYHSVSEVLADRRNGENLSALVDNILHSPAVLEQIDTPFELIQSLNAGDFVDMSTDNWRHLSVELQNFYASEYQLWYGKYSGLGITSILEISPDCPMTLMLIPPMKYWMGSVFPYEDRTDYFGEAQHLEFVDYAFWMGAYEVTHKQWWSTDYNVSDSPSFEELSNFPVTAINVFDAKAFCKKTNTKLPNEIEWELACRAGTTSNWHFGEACRELKNYGWWHSNSEFRIHHVGELKANAWGLYDMYGNVHEWCRNTRDFREKNISRNESQMARGGSYLESWSACRSASRQAFPRGDRNHQFGFRVMRKV